MQISIPYNYQADIVKKRHRLEERAYFWEWLIIDLPTYDEDEAPIATQWVDNLPQLQNYTARGNWGIVTEDGIMQTRWLDDSHWWPYISRTNKYDHEIGSMMKVEELIHQNAKGLGVNNPVMSDSRNIDLSEPQGKPLIEDDYKSVNNSTKVAEIQKILDKVVNLIVVDGKIWIRGAEPVLFLKSWELQNRNPKAYIKVLPLGHKDLTDAQYTYSADRFAEASNASNPFDNSDLPNINEDRKLDVLISESKRFDDNLNVMIEASQIIVDKYSTKKLSDVTEEIALAYFSLKNDLSKAIDDPKEADVVAMSLDNMTANIQHSDSHYYEKGVRALDRWNTRPITLTIDEMPTP